MCIISNLCSVMATSPTRSNDLLRDLYLSDLHQVNPLVLGGYLVEKDVITSGEASCVSKCENDKLQTVKLCDILDEKGNSNLSTNRHFIRSFQTQQWRGEEDDVEPHTRARQRSANAESPPPARLQGGGQEVAVPGKGRKEEDGKRRRAGPPPEVGRGRGEECNKIR